MTERKPFGTSWESFVDRQVREAEERGLFEGLKGKGKPIPGQGEPYQENWWLQSFLAREELSILPGSLELRRDVEKELERLSADPDDQRVRLALEALNRKIAHENARITSGPSSNLSGIDVERYLAARRARVDSRPD